MSEIVIGEKGNESLNPGYVWAPYIILDSVDIKIRYGSTETKQQRRSKKIRKIFKNG